METNEEELEFKAPFPISSPHLDESLAKLQLELDTFGHRLWNERATSEKKLFFAFLLNRAAHEIGGLRRNINESNEFLAWKTRNLFEIKLISKAVTLSRDYFLSWINQRASDEIDAMEGFLALASEDAPEVEIIKKRISTIHIDKSKFSPETAEISKPQKFFRIDQLAKEFGYEREYVAFHKLYSKFVHPSSWLINGDREHLQRKHFRGIFLVLAQTNASEVHQIFTGAI